MSEERWKEVDLAGLKPGAHIHLMGICGTAMGSLAGLLKEMGYQVSGSDQNVYPPMSTQLRQLGIEILSGYRAENLQPAPDLVIVGNVITRQHEEAQALLASSIPFTSLPVALGEFLIGSRHSVVISGTHGKTTTTSLVAWMAQTAQLQPGFLIGGVPKNFDLSFQVPKGDHFVIEGDEYDTAFFDKVPKFNHYRPRSVILTSIEFDHADIYKDLDDVRAAFRQLLKRLPADGCLVAHYEDENIRQLVADQLAVGDCAARVVWYGAGGDYQVVEVDEGASTRLQIREPDGTEVAVEMALFGKYNISNALAAYALGRELNWPLEAMQKSLASFGGVKRRQEVIGQPGGITLIEDFAHHPTAVQMTIEAVQSKYAGRVFSVFEPRSATSRRKIFQKDYLQAFSGAQNAVIARPYDQSRIAAEERFSTDELVTELQNRGVSAHAVDGNDEIIAHIAAEARAGDVVLVMSNGGFGGLYPQLIKALEAAP